MGAAEKIEVGDYDLKTADLRTYYAGFCRRALPDGSIWRLSLASSCLPEGHPGYMVWLTMVSGTDRFGPKLHDWAMGLAATIAVMKPRLKTRARTYVASYDHAWGRQAAADGLNIALYGSKSVPSIRQQAEALECDREAYGRIRNFVAGSLLLASDQYEDALQWAHRVAKYA